ncbi:KANSL3 [Lepeophtheirus salmonis]|uniref:KANSL3 n=1 Tax=Lepeophtheirus salmonis TaxID=72036 RepID=A0A7R8CX42_LEPSM|nr:KANSL3 [Lepeophtheirus salmonis]CAF2957466.1 KANSL3 [Lepeophtheirus salmonis]
MDSFEVCPSLNNKERRKKDEEMINVMSEVEDHENEDLSSRYIHLVSREERIHGNFSDDHGYSKPFNWRPDHPLSRPTKTLFIPRVIRQCNKYLKRNYEDDEIDVVNTDVEKNAFLPGKYDYDKAIKFMKEPERFVSFANTQFCVLPDKEDMEWDEASIPKDNWTSAQTRLFNKAFKILNADRLSHLATEGVLNEPVLRRLSADKTSKRFRLILSEILWDSKLTRWLHETFCEHLPRHHIATYLEVLQSLRAKMPTLVDKMTSGKLPMDISTQLAKEGLQLLIKRPWDPVVTSLGEENIKKLPNNPLLILICKESWTLRSKRWALMLSHLGKLVVLDYSSEDSKKMTVSAYLHHMITQTIAKIRDRFGCLSSCCHGKCSCNFGQNSLLCRSDDIEDMREKMKAETGLIIVGEADDALRVSKIKKCLEGITQSMGSTHDTLIFSFK